MSNHMLPAARRLAQALGPSEDSVDTSIVKGAHLLISIVEARKETGTAAETCHDAVVSATEGLTALTKAREHFVTCHQQLAALRDRFGLPPHAVGCTWRKLEEGGGEESALKAPLKAA